MYVNTFCDVNVNNNSMNDIKKQVGERLKLERKSKGYTQAQVASMMYMTQQQYSRFENGLFELSYAQLVFLAQLYEVSLDYIFGLTKF